MAAALADPPRLSCIADDLWPSMWFRYYFAVGYPDRSQRLV